MALALTYPDGGAIVAGGTGNVGSGVVTKLAEAGLPVTFTYLRNEHAAIALQKDLSHRGLRVQAVRMDMRDTTSVNAALDEATAFAGRLHTVACATGATLDFNTLADFEVAEVEAFLDGDAMAYYRLFHEVVPRLRATGGGTITVTTTIATDRVIAFDGLSPFSKGAVKALVRQVAAEEGRHGIRCNDVAIGWISTASVADMRAMVTSLPSPMRERFGELIEQIAGLLRVHGPGSPADAGNLFAYLASDQSEFITGQSIAIDGGITL